MTFTRINGWLRYNLNSLCEFSICLKEKEVKEGMKKRV